MKKEVAKGMRTVANWGLLTLYSWKPTGGLFFIILSIDNRSSRELKRRLQFFVQAGCYTKKKK